MENSMGKYTNGPLIFLKYAMIMFLAFVISNGVFHIIVTDCYTEQTGVCTERIHDSGELGDWDFRFAKTKDPDMILPEEKQDSQDVVSGLTFTDTVSGLAYEGRI